MSPRCLLLLMVSLLAVSCEFRPLEEPTSVSYVRIYVDEESLNVTTGFYNPDFEHPTYIHPEIFRLGLFDASTGVLVSERYLRDQGDDARGHYFEGNIIIRPGTYNLVAYNFGTESTVVGYEYNCFEIKAFTNEIAPSLKSKFKSRSKGETKADEVIRYDADPLYIVNAERLDVPAHVGIDTLRNAAGEPWFVAANLVKSYYLQIGVENAQYIASSACLLSGMADSSHILEPDYESADETTLYFEMLSGEYPDGYKPGVKDYHCIYTTFGTFGRLPGADNILSASFEFVTTYGKQVDTTFNIALEFLKDTALENQWLLLDCVITIPPPGPEDPDGPPNGFAPGVDPWKDEHQEIEI